MKLFKVGWSILHHEVLLFTARSLQDRLAQMAGGLRDPQHIQDLTRMVAALKSDIQAGKPWPSYRRLDSLGTILERSTILAWKALLSEYPFLPEAFAGGPKDKEREKGGSRFIWTAKQVQAVQEFVKGLGIAKEEGASPQLS